VTVRLLEQATTLIPEHAPPTARAWLAGQLAEQRAASGDRYGHHEAAERMETAFAEDRDPEAPRAAAAYAETAVLTFWGPGGVGPDQARGVGYAQAGYARAVEVLGRAVARTTEPLGAVTLLLDLGQAHLRLGEVDAAVDSFVQAVPLAAANGHRSRIDWIAGVREGMPASAAVADLDEVLSAV